MGTPDDVLLVFGILAFVVLLAVGFWLTQYTEEASTILGTLGFVVVVVGLLLQIILLPIVGIILIVVAVILWALGLAE